MHGGFLPFYLPVIHDIKATVLKLNENKWRLPDCEMLERSMMSPCMLEEEEHLESGQRHSENLRVFGYE
jgi:tRNA A58 N-methylase Trm61